MDMQKIRSNFPALGKDQVFFDNAGGSQVLGSVIDSYVSQPRALFALYESNPVDV